MTERTNTRISIENQAEVASDPAELRRQLAAAKLANRELQRQLDVQVVENERVQSLLRSMVDHAPNYIHIVDTDLRVTFINRGGGKLQPADIIGTKVGDYMLPAHRHRVRRRLRRVLKTGQSTQYEFAGKGENDAVAWYRTTAGPIDSDGTITGLILITFDVTEDRYRTEALREGKQEAETARLRDRALLNSIGEGLIVIDEIGEVADVNPSACRLLCYEREELVGEWFPGVMSALDDNGNEIHPLDRPALQSLSSGEAISATLQYRRKDGTYFPAAITISPVVLDGRPVGAVEVFRDLTRERELELAKEEFVSLASHQLRTPATGVKAYISMLLDGYTGNFTDQQRKFLEKVLHSNERQIQIINDMLSVAQIDAGRMIPIPTPTDLTQLMNEVVEEQRPTIEDRKQVIDLRLPNQPIKGAVDCEMVRMAMDNLVSNASKYTIEGGSIKLALEATATVARITIEDTGVGIAKNDLPRLFKRFSRIDNPLSTKRGGSGLGLYLAHNVIELHRGRLEVESELGKGSIFSIELPLGLRQSAAVFQPTGRSQRL